MRKWVIRLTAAFLLCPVIAIASAWGGPLPSTDNTDLKQEVADLKNRVAVLEQKTGPDTTVLSMLSGIRVGGGISAGWFYAENPGKDQSDNEFLLSNFLVEFSSRDTNLPVVFAGAFGETSTPSLLSTPENNTDVDIEYASLTVKPAAEAGLEVGLLQPNAGFESTYTFNNNNIVLGAVASQQPYNAYGARLGYDVIGLHVCAGYYKKRLDADEYDENGFPPGDSWEIGMSGSVADNKFGIYHYHLEGRRNLTGAFVERTINNIYLAADIDCWNRDTTRGGYYAGRSAVGGAFYVVPAFGRFSIPVRLEYIDQGRGRVYIDNADTKRIYTATISPTYRFCKNAYVRVESAYVDADNAFADKNGNRKDDRICLSAEVGTVF